MISAISISISIIIAFVKKNFVRTAFIMVVFNILKFLIFEEVIWFRRIRCLTSSKASI
jgi:hypothetical protein